MPLDLRVESVALKQFVAPLIRKAFSAVSCCVCGASATTHFVVVDKRDYWRCHRCEATFLDPAQRPSADVEYLHYLSHRNEPSDLRYRRFLSKLATPLLERLPPHQVGLDYGCGPGPALADMLRESGHQMRLFDPLFFPDSTALEETYDVITCSEVAEHFHTPAHEFDRFDRMLRPGGCLAVMTCFQTEDSRFANWHYRADPTHVVFYRARTFDFIAGERGWRCEIPVKDIALMWKPSAAHSEPETLQSALSRSRPTVP